ncbi:unnamed protein product [Rangifer tarandus platyrhynchus]|uniref:Uncharacterized protein n=1 Tax=Rangifer tarandus platyrhynchus TaxID=3082113 RepID=A0AC59ZIS2_RANTA
MVPPTSPRGHYTFRSSWFQAHLGTTLRSREADSEAQESGFKAQSDGRGPRRLPQAKRLYRPRGDRGFWRALAAKQLWTDAARPKCETEDAVFLLGNGHLRKDNGPVCSFCSPLLTS